MYLQNSASQLQWEWRPELGGEMQDGVELLEFFFTWSKKQLLFRTACGPTRYPAHKGRDKNNCNVKLQFKINFSYPSCCLSVSLTEQIFMIKAEEEQKGAKTLWIIQEQHAMHENCFWKIHERTFDKKRTVEMLVSLENSWAISRKKRKASHWEHSWPGWKRGLLPSPHSHQHLQHNEGCG